MKPFLWKRVDAVLGRLGLERIANRWLKRLSYDTRGNIELEFRNGTRYRGTVVMVERGKKVS
jgi:hypothetical protein